MALSTIIHIKAARHWIRASSVSDAVAEFEAWRDDNGFGARDIGGMHPLYEARNASATDLKQIGTVSYNGRVMLCAS